MNARRVPSCGCTALGRVRAGGPDGTSCALRKRGVEEGRRNGGLRQPSYIAPADARRERRRSAGHGLDGAPRTGAHGVGPGTPKAGTEGCRPGARQARANVPAVPEVRACDQSPSGDTGRRGGGCRRCAASTNRGRRARRAGTNGGPCRPAPATGGGQTAPACSPRRCASRHKGADDTLQGLCGAGGNCVAGRGTFTGPPIDKQGIAVLAGGQAAGLAWKAVRVASSRLKAGPTAAGLRVFATTQPWAPAQAGAPSPDGVMP